jgi:type VI secretion system FHA domain protein
VPVESATPQVEPTTQAAPTTPQAAPPDIPDSGTLPEPSFEAELPEPVLSWTSAAQHGAIEAVTTIILAPTAPSEGDEAQLADASTARNESPPSLAQSAPEVSARTPAPPMDGSLSNQALLEALLAGAGIRGVDVPGGLTPERMKQMGALLREATAGLLDLLAARALTKREVRADMTVIVASDNNPLKFSPDREAALTHLLVPRGRGFMPPLRAVTDAYDDLRAHQLGFMAGMKSALSVVLGRFNPQTLEQRLIGTTMVDSFLPTHRKAKLWDLFSELYGKISTEAHTDFHALFGQEFLRAYRAHVTKTPQHGEADGKRP